jgi:gluconolactonase
LPAGIGPVEKFADVGSTPQGQFPEGGAFDKEGKSVVRRHRQRLDLVPDVGRQACPGVQLLPAARIGPDLRVAGQRLARRQALPDYAHRGILTYDPQTKEVKTLVYTYRNQLFKGPNDLDFDADGNLFFTDPWATGPGPSTADRTDAVYQYSRDGVFAKDHRRHAVPERDRRVAGQQRAGDRRFQRGAVVVRGLMTGPTMGCPQ